MGAILLLPLLHTALGMEGAQGFVEMKSLLTDFRSEAYALGSSVDLTCINKSQNDMIYTIWKLNTSRSECTIASGIGLQGHDTCNDGNLRIDTTSGGVYLYILEFTKRDEGFYHCEASHRDGSYSAEINVSAKVSPQISTRLDLRDGKREAVCSAVGGKPAASISWRNTWNSSVTQTFTQNSDGSFTVESRFILPDPVSADNLSCIVTHPSWREEHTEAIQASSYRGTIESTPSFTLQYSVLSICCVILLSGVFIAYHIIRTAVRERRDRIRRPISRVYT